MELSSFVLLNFLFLAVSCSFEAKCKTSNKSVEKYFAEDTQVFLDKAGQIYTCGKGSYMYDYSTSSYFFNQNNYKDCIFDLKIPKRYEDKIKNFVYTDFENKLNYKDSVQTVSDKVCANLNNEFNLKDCPDVKTIVLVSREETTKTNEANDTTATLSKSNSYGYIILFSTVISCIALICVVLYFYQRASNKKKLASFDPEAQNDTKLITPTPSSASASTSPSFMVSEAPPSYDNFAAETSLPNINNEKMKL